MTSTRPPPPDPNPGFATDETTNETCNTGDDCNGGQCAGPEGKRFCKCKPQLEGDKCKTIKDCDSGKYSECKKSGGDCEFDGIKTACKCPEDKKLDESLTKHICRGLVGQDDSQTTTALRYQHLGWDCGIYFVRPIPTNMAQWENLSDILGGDVSRITLREVFTVK
ncbi:hypothetical protein AVEN_227627-1 [Araneus ventricosus]|uniref:EGF-like domain-containing protein n=1 Tax=Araneus ventricosus TaxID=182803 RepID=A0A4Y1ZXI8_ARAVE|nr:hypothetical protein AVEN_227627-1 [Araneus ventricosus]